MTWTEYAEHLEASLVSPHARVGFSSHPVTLSDAQRLINGDGDWRDCFWGVWPLARIAVDAFAARTELLRVRRLLGSHFGLADFA